MICIYAFVMIRLVIVFSFTAVTEKLLQINIVRKELPYRWQDWGDFCFVLLAVKWWKEIETKGTLIDGRKKFSLCVMGTVEKTGWLSLSWESLQWLVAQNFEQVAKNPPVMQEMQVWSLGQEDPLEEGMATHCSILVWRIPWTEEPDRLQSIGLQTVGHDWGDLACLHGASCHGHAGS